MSAAAVRSLLVAVELVGSSAVGKMLNNLKVQRWPRSVKAQLRLLASFLGMFSVLHAARINSNKFELAPLLCGPFA